MDGYWIAFELILTPEDLYEQIGLEFILAPHSRYSRRAHVYAFGRTNISEDGCFNGGVIGTHQQQALACWKDVIHSHLSGEVSAEFSPVHVDDDAGLWE